MLYLYCLTLEKILKMPAVVKRMKPIGSEIMEKTELLRTIKPS